MRHKKLFLSSILVFVLLVFGFVVSVEASSAGWSRTYGGESMEVAHCLVETSDGGYALAGDSRLVKTDASGVMEWNQTYVRGGVSAVVQTSDGGYVLTGYIGTLNPLIGIEYYCWLVKTDAYGNMLWNWTYGDGSALSLVETSDGGYALAGGAGLIRIDAHGNMIWNQTYKGTPYALVETSDGGYVLAGKTGSIVSGKTDFWLAKTDEKGFIPEFHPPYICVGSPQNKTYITDRVSLNFTVNEEASWMGYSLDGQDNVTITKNTLTLTELADGLHTLTVYATDTDGKTAASETISFTIKATPTKWITAIIIAAVAATAAALLIIYTRKKKNRTKK